MEKFKILFFLIFLNWTLIVQNKCIFIPKKSMIFILLLVFPLLMSSQNNGDKIDQLKSNIYLFKSFDRFYNNSIREETKGESERVYYNEIDQIYSIHYFDYNEDGLKDVLVEFTVTKLNGSNNNFLVAVLFKNVEGRYKYIAHMNPDNTTFVNYSKSIFQFSGEIRSFSEGVVTEKYTLQSNKFTRQ